MWLNSIRQGGCIRGLITDRSHANVVSHNSLLPWPGFVVRNVVLSRAQVFSEEDEWASSKEGKSSGDDVIEQTAEEESGAENDGVGGDVKLRGHESALSESEGVGSEDEDGKAQVQTVAFHRHSLFYIVIVDFVLLTASPVGFRCAGSKHAPCAPLAHRRG